MMVKRIPNPTGRNAHGEKGEGRNARINLTLYPEDKEHIEEIAQSMGLQTRELIRYALQQTVGLKREEVIIPPKKK